MKNICGIDFPIPLSVAPTGLSIFFHVIPRAARTYSPLTLGYVLTAPSEPLPLRGFFCCLDKDEVGIFSIKPFRAYVFFEKYSKNHLIFLQCAVIFLYNKKNIFERRERFFINERFAEDMRTFGRNACL